MIDENFAFVDANTLKDIGFWSEMFKDHPRTIPVYCFVCTCQRMHKKSSVSPEFQEIHDGKRWKNIVVGLYFDCIFCKEKDNNGQ